MCRNIRVLYNFDPPTTPEEVRAAALQYVRKVSGLAKAPAGRRGRLRPGGGGGRRRHRAPPPAPQGPDRGPHAGGGAGEGAAPLAAAGRARLSLAQVAAAGPPAAASPAEPPPAGPPGPCAADRPGDAPRVPAHAGERRRGHRVEEVQARRSRAPAGWAPPRVRAAARRRSPKTGSSIQEKPGWNPVHQMTLATSRTRPSASSGRPSRTPITRATRSTPAAASSAGFTRTSGVAAREQLGPAPAGRWAC